MFIVFLIGFWFASGLYIVSYLKPPHFKELIMHAGERSPGYLIRVAMVVFIAAMWWPMVLGYFALKTGKK